MAEPSTESPTRALERRHLWIGWWSILAFLTLGMALEAMHGFKLGWYLDVASETRRLMWRLAHAHGVLIGLLNVAFGFTVGWVGGENARVHRIASPCLVSAGILVPSGFLLGGIFIHGGDPGLGILLVPIGAVLLFTSVFLTASATSATGRRKKK